MRKVSFFLSLVSEEYGLVIGGLLAFVAVFDSSSGVMKLLTVRWMMFPFMLLMMLGVSSSPFWPLKLSLILVPPFRIDLGFSDSPCFYSLNPS